MVIGSDRFAAGYNVAKLAHERATLAGPIPARGAVPRVRRTAPRVGTPDGIAYVPEMRTQLVAARTLAEALLDLALAARAGEWLAKAA